VDLPLLGDRVDFDHTQGRAHAQGAVEDVDAEDDRVALGERGYGLQPARPDGLRSGVAALRLHDLGVVSGKSVEQVIDDVG
jgi:hypothetical protein